MVDLVGLSTAWAIASAFAVVLLGLTSLLGGRARPPGSFPFGLFAVIWGLQIILANTAGYAPNEGLASVAFLLSLAFLVPLAYFLVELGHAHSTRSPAWTALRITSAVFAIGAAGLLLLRPSLLFTGVVESMGQFFPQWGPLLAPVVAFPHFIAFGIALVAIHSAMQSAPTPRTRRRLGTLVAGLGLYVGYASSTQLVIYSSALSTGGSSVALLSLVFLLTALVALVVGVRAWVAARYARTAREANVERFVSAALLFPLAWGLVEGFLYLGPARGLHTVGLWRLAGVGIMAYGLARWRLFDLPQRVRRAASSATGAAGAAAGGVTVYGAFSLLTTSILVPGLAASAVFLVTLLPGVRLARRVFGLGDRTNPVAYEETLYEQRVDSYRAALEAAMSRGSLDEDETFLAALRERYAITDDEDRILRYYARNSVVVPREGTIASAYERLRILGEGGGGRTWLARDRARDRLVVIKEPLARWQQDPQLRSRLLDEARVAAKVRHRHVVRVEEVVEQDGVPYMVMEHLEGGSLADLLRSRGVLPWREAVSLLHDVLSGLEAVHGRGIVHRDIKPSNILLTGDGVPKLADFGIAVVRWGGGGTQVEDGPRSGTVAYMPPEVREGTSSNDPRLDIYGCGALLHECLFGSPPGLEGALVVSAEVPPALQTVLAKTLAKDPVRRYRSARELSEALAQVTRQ